MIFKTTSFPNVSFFDKVVADIGDYLLLNSINITKFTFAVSLKSLTFR